MAKILLVEDDKSLREIYGVRLLAEGYDIVSAGDGEEALAMAIKDRPTLIVSDVMMPKISGFDMLDILRSTTETKDIKVIMMTALSSEDQRQRGEQLGADRYLVKSQVGIEDVVRTVHEVLGDAPLAQQPQNAFAAPGPSAARPAATTVPSRPTTPTQAASVAAAGPVPAVTPSPSPAPATPAPTTAPTAAPAPMSPAPAYSSGPQPVAVSQTNAPSQSPAPFSSLHSSTPPTTSGLPQPTAPFSTSRPVGLADRIIQPLEKSPEDGEPIADLMSKELDTTQPDTSFSPPTSQPPVAPSSDSASTSDQAPEQTHGIDFEETPRNDATAV